MLEQRLMNWKNRCIGKECYHKWILHPRRKCHSDFQKLNYFLTKKCCSLAERSALSIKKSEILIKFCEKLIWISFTKKKQYGLSYYISRHGSCPSFNNKTGKRCSPAGIFQKILGNVLQYISVNCPLMRHNFNINKKVTARQNIDNALFHWLNYDKLKKNYHSE